MLSGLECDSLYFWLCMQNQWQHFQQIVVRAGFRGLSMLQLTCAGSSRCPVEIFSSLYWKKFALMWDDGAMTFIDPLVSFFFPLSSVCVPEAVWQWDSLRKAQVIIPDYTRGCSVRATSRKTQRVLYTCVSCFSFSFKIHIHTLI